MSSSNFQHFSVVSLLAYPPIILHRLGISKLLSMMTHLKLVLCPRFLFAVDLHVYKRLVKLKDLKENQVDTSENPNAGVV